MAKNNVSRSKAEIAVDGAIEAISWRGITRTLVMERTWPLAAAIIVPIIIGLYLDKFFHTFPGLFIASLILAAILVTRLALKVVKSDS